MGMLKIFTTITIIIVLFLNFAHGGPGDFGMTIPLAYGAWSPDFFRAPFALNFNKPFFLKSIAY